MYCSKCGAKVEGAAKFCSSCGNKLMSIDNKMFRQSLGHDSNIKFEQLIMIIAAFVYPFSMILLPSFVEKYTYMSSMVIESRISDSFWLISDTNNGWDGLTTAVITILILMIAVSIINIFCSFGKRRKYIIIPSIANVVLLISLYVSAEIISCEDGHRYHELVIPHIGYIFTIIAILLTLIFSFKVYSEYKYKNAEYLNKEVN